MNNTQKTHVSKKEEANEKCSTKCCSEKFEKISTKTSVVVYSFWFYYQKHSTKDVFFAIFPNILEHFRAAASEIQESSLTVFFATEAAIRRSCNKEFLKIPYRLFIK